MESWEPKLTKECETVIVSRWQSESPWLVSHWIKFLACSSDGYFGNWIIYFFKVQKSNFEVTDKYKRHEILEANPDLHWHIQCHFPEQTNIKIV